VINNWTTGVGAYGWTPNRLIYVKYCFAYREL